MARRNVDAELARDVLVDISQEDERRFGIAGKMLKPRRASVEALVAAVPEGRVLTTARLRQRLAEQHQAEVTCPFLTKRALLAIAEDAAATAPVWRIVMPGGEMLSFYPGGEAAQARRLSAEGIALAVKAGKNKVATLGDKLAML